MPLQRPACRSSGVSAARRFTPPRTLNAPVGLRFSHLSTMRQPSAVGKLRRLERGCRPQIRCNGTPRLEHVGQRRYRPAPRAFHRCLLSGCPCTVHQAFSLTFSLGTLLSLALVLCTNKSSFLTRGRLDATSARLRTRNSPAPARADQTSTDNGSGVSGSSVIVPPPFPVYRLNQSSWPLAGGRSRRRSLGNKLWWRVLIGDVQRELEDATVGQRCQPLAVKAQAKACNGFPFASFVLAR